MGSVCNNTQRDTNEWAETIIIELSEPVAPSKSKIHAEVPLELPALHPNVIEIRSQKRTPSPTQNHFKPNFFNTPTTFKSATTKPKMSIMDSSKR
jgi:hypothetical protein